MNHILFSVEGEVDVQRVSQFTFQGFLPLSVGKIGEKTILYGLTRDERLDDHFLWQMSREKELSVVMESFSVFCGGRNPDVQVCSIPDGESEKDASWCFGIIKTVVAARKNIKRKKTMVKVKGGYLKNFL